MRFEPLDQQYQCRARLQPDPICPPTREKKKKKRGGFKKQAQSKESFLAH